MTNTYTGHRRVTGDEPDRPWAVYLAGTDHPVPAAVFDLDATIATAGRALLPVLQLHDRQKPAFGVPGAAGDGGESGENGWPTGGGRWVNVRPVPDGRPVATR